MAASDRRLLVSYEAANNASAPTHAVAREAALGGMFIETTSPLSVGALLSIEVAAPNTAVTLEARVFSTRAKAEGPTKPAGMAVRFLDLPDSMLGKLQTILDHHRPPARTRLGVGDENEALWASAGGRDEGGEPDRELLDIAAEVTVDGRPTPDMPAPTPQEPEPPRYPTPRMIPLTPPLPPPSQPLAWAAPESAEPLPSSRAPTIVVKPPTNPVVIAILVLVALFAIGAVTFIFFTRLR